MRLPKSSSYDALEVKMTPMIDVVFLLLIFFVWTSSFELPEFDLPSALAEPPPSGAEVNTDVPPPVEVFDEIVIRLFLQDAVLLIQLNGNAVDDIDALRSQLTAILALGVQPPVIIDPADHVTMDAAVAVYDVARAAGADRVLFAARADDPQTELAR
tara:strand:+ start:521984 stop:522454 length:471 start_codon:yes stop_codon:yes gene_type:complete